MKFKSKTLISQFFRLVPILRVILSELDCFSQLKFQKEIVITSIYRKDDRGVHGYWRGTDIRCEHAGKYYYTKKEIESILDYINNKYVYDPNRPHYKVLIYHKVRGSVFHLHAQVHPNTTMQCKLSSQITIPKKELETVIGIIEKWGKKIV